MFSGDAEPFVPHHFLFAVWSFADRLAGYEQQDAHEFFITVLDGIHTSCKGLNSSVRRPGQRRKKPERLRVHEPLTASNRKSKQECCHICSNRRSHRQWTTMRHNFQCSLIPFHGCCVLFVSGTPRDCTCAIHQIFSGQLRSGQWLFALPSACVLFCL